MTTPHSEQWSQVNKLSIAPIMEFNGITVRLLGEMTRENLSVLNEILQGNAQHLHDVSHAKGLEEAMGLQSRYISRMGPRMFEHAQHILDTMLDSANQYQHWFEKGMKKYQQEGKAVVEKMKDATHQATHHRHS